MLVIFSYFIYFVVKRQIKVALFILLVSLAIYSPLVLWRFLIFGHLETSPSYFLTHTPLLQKYGFFLRRVSMLFLILYMLNITTGGLLLSIYGVFKMKNKLIGLFPLFFYVLFDVFFYSIIMPSVKYRYLAPITSILIIFIPTFFLSILNILNLKRKFGLIMTSLILFIYFFYIFLLSVFCLSGFGYCPDSEIKASIEAEMPLYQMSMFIKRNLPDDARIAIGHIGLIQYFSERIIVDVGGKVDYGVVDARLNNRLEDYLKEKKVNYLIISFEDARKEDIITYVNITKKYMDTPLDIVLSNNFYVKGGFALVKIKDEYIKKL